MKLHLSGIWRFNRRLSSKVVARMGPLEPQQLLEAAALLGIDHSNPSQTHLLAVARAYIELPLPDAWERSVNDQGKAAYVNKR